MNPDQCAGIILSGGLSTRMGGQPKAFMDLAGRPLIQHTLDTLQSMLPEVLIAAKDTSDFARFEGVSLVRDAWPLQTPLAGILAGLQLMRAQYAFCVGCDTPLLSPRVVRLLLEAIEPGIDVVVPYSGEYFQPLCAVYAKSCLDVLQEQLELGDPKVDRLFARLHLKTVSYEAIESVDPELNSFINVNTPEDLELVKARLQSGDGNPK